MRFFAFGYDMVEMLIKRKAIPEEVKRIEHFLLLGMAFTCLDSQAEYILKII